MSLLQKKYAILQQQANTAANLAASEGGLNDARARALGTEAPANAAAQYGLGGQYRANAGLLTNQAGEVGANAASERALQGAQARGLIAGAGQQEFQTQQAIIRNPSQVGEGVGMNFANMTGQHLRTDAEIAANPRPGYAPAAAGGPTSYGTTYRSVLDNGLMGASAATQANSFDVNSADAGLHSAPAPVAGEAPQASVQAPPTDPYEYDTGRAGSSNGIGFSGGTQKVPGKGDGTVDTVPAMLAPGEAVLNKGAAEHVGRGMIAAINKIGLAKMDAAKGGAPAPKGKGMKKGGMVSYAMGIDEVPAIAATPATQATQGGLQKRPKGYSKGTAKVTKGGKSARAQTAPPVGGGALGLGPDMASAPPGTPSPEQLNPILQMLTQQPQAAA